MALLPEELSEPERDSVPELSFSDLLIFFSLFLLPEPLRLTPLSLELEKFLFLPKLEFLLDFDLEWLL